MDKELRYRPIIFLYKMQEIESLKIQISHKIHGAEYI